MITQDKAEEYQEVAALVCQDLDLLLEVANNGGDLTADELRAQIRLTHEKKERLINDPVKRQRRYKASCALWAAVAAGLVRSEPLT